MIVRILTGTLLIATVSIAEPFAVKTEESIFAVVTQRGGIAARFAHDHIIAASEHETSIVVDGATIAESAFKCRANDLVVDEPVVKEQWAARIIAAKLLSSEPKAISEGDRVAIRDNMLGEEQLDEAKYPEIEARLVSMNQRKRKFRGVTYTHTAVIELTVHGKTVSREIAANVHITGDSVTIEAAASFRFTDFGIEPYSAMMGAVKNQDEFFLYCYLVAAPKE